MIEYLDGLSGGRALLPVALVVELQVLLLEPQGAAVGLTAAHDVSGAHETAQSPVPGARRARQQHEL